MLAQCVWEGETGRCLVRRRCVHLSGGVRAAAAVGANARFVLAESRVLRVLVLVDCRALQVCATERECVCEREREREKREERERVCVCV